MHKQPAMLQFLISVLRLGLCTCIVCHCFQFVTFFSYSLLMCTTIHVYRLKLQEKELRSSYACLLVSVLYFIQCRYALMHASNLYWRDPWELNTIAMCANSEIIF